MEIEIQFLKICNQRIGLQASIRLAAKLVSLCDIVPTKARKFGEHYNVPFFYDMHEMVRSESIDVLVVLTESGNHARHVKELAKYGKDIIVEKPMALTLD